jgi:hypothetical protein
MPMNHGSPSSAAQIALLLFVSGGLASLAGITMPSAAWTAVGTCAIAAALIIGDVMQRSWRRVTLMTVYAFGTFLVSVANLLALAAADGPNRNVYFLYAIDEHLPLAMHLTLAGLVIPIVAFRMVSEGGTARELLRLFPAVRGDVDDRSLLRWGVTIAFIAILMRIYGPIGELGAVSALVWLLPQLTSFSLARRGTMTGNNKLIVAGFGVALADALRALLFDFLRGDIIAPILAFSIGALLGARNLRVLRRWYFVPIHAAAVLFIIYFGAFGAQRQSMSAGVSRLEQLAELGDQDLALANSPAARQTVLSRLTTINQVTQIGRLVDEGGHLGGSTLEYLGFAFVPRVLWPEKPLIAKGAWFALQIGQARISETGRITNAVNMTVPGELYLNFGWLGVLVGLLLFGALLALLWDRSRFWEFQTNTLGTAFGYYLLSVALTLAADLQIVVTMIALYLLFALGSMAMRLVGAGMPQPPVPAMPSRSGDLWRR